MSADLTLKVGFYALTEETFIRQIFEPVHITSGFSFMGTFLSHTVWGAIVLTV
jgi:hypothetical protein